MQNAPIPVRKALHNLGTVAVACAALLLANLASAEPAAQPPIRPAGPDIEFATGAVEAQNTQGARVEVFPDGRYLVLERESRSAQFTGRFLTAAKEPEGEPFLAGPAGDVRLVSQALSDERWALAWYEQLEGQVTGQILLDLYVGSEAILTREVVADEVAIGYATDVVMETDGVGRFVIGWTTYTDPRHHRPRRALAQGRIYDHSGTALTEIFQVSEDPRERTALTDVTYLEPGEMVFVWHASAAGSTEYEIDAYRRHFSDSGLPLGAQTPVHSLVSQGIDVGRADHQLSPSVAPVDGGYVVAWIDWSRPHQEGHRGRVGGVIARLFDRDGDLLREDVVSRPGQQTNYYSPAVASTQGSYAVVWETTCRGERPNCFDGYGDSPDGSGSGVFGRTFSLGSPDDPSSHLESSVFTVPVKTLANQILPSVEGLPGGEYLVTWTDLFPRSPRRGRVLRPGPCRGLCLDGGRFEITAHWRDFADRRGEGQPVARGGDWGTFWFFRPENVELAVKVLDGQDLTDHFWLFFASLSNVEYAVDAWDLVTGQTRRYENPQGVFASRGDVTALPAEAASTSADSSAHPAGLGTAPRAPAAGTAPLTLAPCEPDDLCLQGDRFLVEIEWRDFQDRRGKGVGAPFSEDSAWFWFFREGNPEVLVKVLDGAPVNGHWWVFFGALSNVEFNLTVTDRATNRTATYFSPLDEFAARGDTTAFPGD